MSASSASASYTKSSAPKEILVGETFNPAKDLKYSKPKGLLDEVLGGASPTGRIDLAAIVEFSTPRGWYLCSWLPALVQSE